MLFEALQVYICVPGPESVLLGLKTAKNICFNTNWLTQPAPTCPGLPLRPLLPPAPPPLGHLYEGVHPLGEKYEKVGFWAFRSQKATFGPRDTYVDLQGVEEHLTDPISTPNTQVSGEL